MNDTEQRQVNIPLLRKAVEWAEAEAAKPRSLCEWNQAWFVSNDDKFQLDDRSPECGTCYCIAGWVAAQVTGDPYPSDPALIAADALGIEVDWVSAESHLFSADNSIADVRRIAEDLAGERL